LARSSSLPHDPPRGDASAPEAGAEPAAPKPEAAAAARPRRWDEVIPSRKSDVPAGLWMRCVNCEVMLFRKSIEQNLHVCTECDHHFRINASSRAAQLCDPDSFEPAWDAIRPADPLSFADRKPYGRRLLAEQEKSGRPDALVAGRGFIKGRAVVLCCMDPDFMMGSMGSVVGEKIALAVEAATAENRPLIVVACSGGARMQESSLALLQMAKTSAALARHDEAGGLFISVLTDPTTGGVSASFAMLGDLILAEPKALIGFTGPRVIANTVREELPEGFQRSEHLLEKGFVDRVVHRRDLRSEIGRIVDYAGK
jgi:acetyl-CoA carboxylase carboxyl transferase subunit beta